MFINEHDKIYENTVLKKTIVKIDLEPNNEIDNIIYYLICAQQKLNEDDNYGYEARLESALLKLNKFIKERNK